MLGLVWYRCTWIQEIVLLLYNELILSQSLWLSHFSQSKVVQSLYLSCDFVFQGLKLLIPEILGLSGFCEEMEMRLWYECFLLALIVDLHALIDDVERILWLCQLRSMWISHGLQEEVALEHTHIKHINYINPIGEEVLLFAMLIYFSMMTVFFFLRNLIHVSAEPPWLTWRKHHHIHPIGRIRWIFQFFSHLDIVILLNLSVINIEDIDCVATQPTLNLCRISRRICLDVHWTHEVLVPVRHLVVAAFQDTRSLEVQALIFGSIWTLVGQPCEPVFHLLLL